MDLNDLDLALWGEARLDLALASFALAAGDHELGRMLIERGADTLVEAWASPGEPPPELLGSCR